MFERLKYWSIFPSGSDHYIKTKNFQEDFLLIITAKLKGGFTITTKKDLMTLEKDLSAIGKKLEKLLKEI